MSRDLPPDELRHRRTPESLAVVGGLIGDPVRAAILHHLSDGSRRPATEIAQLAGASPQAASNHLAKLVAGGLLQVEAQGRHRFFAIASGEAADMVEDLTASMPVPGTGRHRRHDPALRRARLCYDHVAGRLGVALFDRMVGRGWLVLKTDGPGLSDDGRCWCRAHRIALPDGSPGRRPFLRLCHDWTERRPHAGGRFGAALTGMLTDAGYIGKRRAGREVDITARGRAFFEAELGIGPLDLATEP